MAELPGNKEKDYLTEQHRIKEKLFVRKGLGYLVIVVLSVCYLFLFDAYINDFFITPEEKKRVQEINKALLQIKTNSQIPRETKTKWIKILEDEKERIEHKHGRFFSIILVKTWTGRLIYFAFIFVFIIFYFFTRKKLKWAKKEIFFQEAFPENPFEVFTDKGFLFELSENEINTFFKDEKHWKKFNNILTNAIVENEKIKFPKKQIAKEIQSCIEDIADTCKFYFIDLDVEKVKTISKIILWHYAVSLYGNAPTGLLSTCIKSKELKKILSLYYRRMVPVLEHPDESDIFTTKFLLLFYRADSEYKIIQRLDKFDPLPFKI